MAQLINRYLSDEDYLCYPPLSRQKSTNFKSELSHMTNGCVS